MAPILALMVDPRKNDIRANDDPSDPGGGGTKPEPPNVDQPPVAEKAVPDEAEPERPAGALDSVEPLTFMPPTAVTAGGTVEGTQKSRPEDRTRWESGEGKPKIPARIGRYDTISILGEGSFGIVLKCADPQLDRLVAIKIAKFQSFGSELAEKRFMGEARSAAQLRHPNIVPVFEYGKFETHHFIAYQFVEGETLKQWHKKGLTHRRAMELIVAICRGLDYAHRQGIIHRDIKPANILVDGQGVPHIADFGCAREQKSDETRTVDGSLLGTPAYMSPESAAGKARQADARTDIWSVGIMMFELLAKRRPFRGGIAKILADVQTAEPGSIRAINRDLPIDLDTIVAKCLQKKQEHRYQTCGELADELERWLENRPILSRRINPLQRIWMWSQRNPKWAAMWGALVTTLLTGLLITSILLVQVRNNQNRLVQSRLDSLLTANPASVPVIIDDLKTLDVNVNHRLGQMLGREGLTPAQTIRLQLASYLLGSGDQGFPAAGSQMLQLEPGDLEMVTIALKQDPADWSEPFWPIALDASRSGKDSMRAACCLAQSDPESENWKQIRVSLIGDLLDENPAHLAVWLRMLQPAAHHLKSDLQKVFVEASQNETRQRAAWVLAVLFKSDLEFLLELAITAEPAQLRELMGPLRARSSEAVSWIENRIPTDESRFKSDDSKTFRPLANDLILLACLGRDRRLREGLTTAADPTLRTALIHWAPPSGLPVSWVSENLSKSRWGDTALLIAAIQMLGEYGEQALYLTKRNELSRSIIDLFENHPDSGVHSSAQWLLQGWGFDDELSASKTRIRTAEPKPGFQWHEDSSGICFAIFGPLTAFDMGQPGNRSGDQAHALFHRRIITRRFGISTTEITTSQYLAGEKQLREWIASRKQAATDSLEKDAWDKRLIQHDRNVKNRGIATGTLLPVANVRWVDAAIFCAMLCREQGIDVEQSPYLVVFPEGRRTAFATYSDAVLSQPHYRLPTSGEFEYAARAGSRGKYHFGESYSMISRYSWTSENSGGVASPVGQLKPNHFGLFDIHGNVSEWCHDPANRYPEGTTEWIDGVVADNPQTLVEIREIRDHYFESEPNRIAIYFREGRSQQLGFPWVGFRIARTYSSANEPND